MIRKVLIVAGAVCALVGAAGLWDAELGAWNLRYLIPIAVFGVCGYGAGVFHARKPGLSFVDLLYFLAGPLALAWVYSQSGRLAAGLAAGGVAMIGFTLAHRREPYADK